MVRDSSKHVGMGFSMEVVILTLSESLSIATHVRLQQSYCRGRLNIADSLGS